MRCLLDADVLLYEAAFGGEYLDEETGEKVPRDFSQVSELFDQKVREIEEACWADEESKLFLTGNPFLAKLENRKRKREGLEPLSFPPNFRFEVAVSVPYKSTRSAKPYHYYNLLAYIYHAYSPIIAWGMEADDMLCIYQQRFLKEQSTIICTRDKDLRMMEGWHYGWECANQAGYSPKLVDSIGELHLSERGKLTGTGLKFFYSQMITGDKVDCIPGLPRGGPVLAYKTLKDCETEVDMYRAVKALYEAKEKTQGYFLEQAYLLWMVRELNEFGFPIMYKLPEEW
tara:strand:- start:24595 stop:25452 length:858 start_codon:yes stop_codon:yes gene_type:complete